MKPVRKDQFQKSKLISIIKHYVSKNYTNYKQYKWRILCDILTYIKILIQYFFFCTYSVWRIELLNVCEMIWKRMKHEYIINNLNCPEICSWRMHCIVRINNIVNSCSSGSWVQWMKSFCGMTVPNDGTYLLRKRSFLVYNGINVRIIIFYNPGLRACFCILFHRHYLMYDLNVRSARFSEVLKKIFQSRLKSSCFAAVDITTDNSRRWLAPIRNDDQNIENNTNHTYVVYYNYLNIY